MKHISTVFFFIPMNRYGIVLIKVVWMNNFRKFSIHCCLILTKQKHKTYLKCVSVNYWINDDFLLLRKWLHGNTVSNSTQIEYVSVDSADIETFERSNHLRKPFIITVSSSCVLIFCVLGRLFVDKTRRDELVSE